MATISNTYVGDGTTVLYSFTFPYINVADVVVSIDGTVQSSTTEYSFANATTIQFTTAPATSAAILIKRVTSAEDVAAVFFPGSAVRARDLNDNFVQGLYVSQESTATAAASSVEAQAASANAALAATAATSSASDAATTLIQANAAAASAATAQAASATAQTQANNASAAAASAAADATAAQASSATAIATANASSAASTQAVADSAAAVVTSNNAATLVATANTNSNAAVVTANQSATDATSAVNIASSAQSLATQAQSDASAAQVAASASQASATAAQAQATLAADVRNAFTITDSNSDGTFDFVVGDIPIKGNNGVKLPFESVTYAEEGAIRYNNSLDKIELYNGAGQWVTAAGGAAVSSSPPSLPSAGDVWYDHDNGRAYVYYNDGDSNQWVEMNPSWNGYVADNSISSAKIIDGAIVNADVNASAAIAGTKISPDFGSQNVVTTGSGSFAGNVTIASSGTFTGSAGILLRADTNQFFINGTADSSSAIDIKGNAIIKGDGGASFASGNFDLANYGALSIKRTDGNNFPLFRWGTDSGYSGGGIYPDGSGTFSGYGSFGGGIRATGNNSGSWSSGSGLEILNGGINAYNRSTSAYIAASINTLNWNIGSTGSADFKGIVTADRPVSGTPASSWSCFNGANNGSVTSSIKADGSAEFSGAVTAKNTLGGGSGNEVFVGKGPTGGGNVAIYSNGSATFDKGIWIAQTAKDGYLNVTQQTGGQAALNIIDGTGASSATIYGNGSAEFKGRFNVAPNGLSTNTDYVSLYDNGAIGVRRNSGNDSDYLWTGISGTTETSRINKDGSAEFANTVNVGSSTNRLTGGGWGYQLYAERNENAIAAYYQSAHTTPSAPYVLRANVAGTDNVVIRSDGSAEFANTVTAGSTSTGTQIFTNGSAIGRLSGVQKWYLNNNGNATFSGSVTASNVSDIRFKENITDANPQLADAVALGSQLKNFDWKDDAPLNEELRAKRFLGLVAQEAEKVCPDLTYTVPHTKQGKELTPEVVVPAVYETRTVPAVLDEEGEVIEAETTEQVLVTEEQITPATYEELDDSYKAINHDILVMKLLGAVAELSAKVETLETKVNALEGA